ncbi:MAG: GAF domain-containing protein [Polaromonas sp.]|nr:GAF domain-containing protein [Polaromonas sp.]
MPLTPDPHPETARLAELERLQVMDSFEEQAYDDITRMAADICGTPIALISLVDANRQWFKSRVGLQARETPRELAFCAHAIQTPEQPMVVRDASQDARFVDNALVTGDPNIRFYAGAPLVTSSGHALGTLCMIDREPRDITPAQLEQLQFLAQQVVVMLEARAAAASPAGTAPKAD